MTTSEPRYNRVMSVSEHAPDGVIVKPFSEATLHLSLARALERSHALALVRKLRAEGRHEALVQACDDLVASWPKFALELSRIKGDALLALERYAQARAVFAQVVQARALPWARLGVARAQAGQGEVQQAQVALTELLADAPEFLAAYDFLSELHNRGHNDEDAKSVLKMAIEVSPNSLRRHKAVGEIALRSNDLETAETAFSTLVRKSRHAFARSPEDHLKLSRIYLQREKFAEALDTVAEVKKTFPDRPVVKISACAVESLIHSKAQNPRDARRSLDEALEAAKMSGGACALDADSALELAQACYRQNREHEAAELVRQVVSNNHDDARLLAEVGKMYVVLDRAEQGQTLINRCVNNAVSINNEGVSRAKNGDLEGAIELLEEAAKTIPDNAHIVMNAAHSLIAHMHLHGLQADKQARVSTYLDRVGDRNPTHPKYLQVSALYRKLLQKYEVTA